VFFSIPLLLGLQLCGQSSHHQNEQADTTSTKKHIGLKAERVRKGGCQKRVL
jgi:hypothetical protein